MMLEELKIKELKEALTEVSKLCFNRLACTQDCPFYVTKWGGCPMKYTNFPEEWDVRVWKENEMIRPIDANALKANLISLPGGYAQSFAGKACLMEIDDAETLDYAPVRHGEWIEKIEPYAYTASGREIHILHCSVCDFTWANKRMVFDHFKHCPNCGAKMDGGKENDT